MGEAMRWYVVLWQGLGNKSLAIPLTDEQARQLARMTPGGSSDERSWSVQAESWVETHL